MRSRIRLCFEELREGRNGDFEGGRFSAPNSAGSQRLKRVRLAEQYGITPLTANAWGMTYGASVLIVPIASARHDRMLLI